MTCLGRAEMKATDDTLINGKEIQLQVSGGQHQVHELRRAGTQQKIHNALLELKRVKEIRSSQAILNSDNNNIL